MNKEKFLVDATRGLKIIGVVVAAGLVFALFTLMLVGMRFNDGGDPCYVSGNYSASAGSGSGSGPGLAVCAGRAYLGLGEILGIVALVGGGLVLLGWFVGVSVRVVRSRLARGGRSS